MLHVPRRYKVVAVEILLFLCFPFLLLKVVESYTHFTCSSWSSPSSTFAIFLTSSSMYHWDLLSRKTNEMWLMLCSSTPSLSLSYLGLPTNSDSNNRAGNLVWNWEFHTTIVQHKTQSPFGIIPVHTKIAILSHIHASSYHSLSCDFLTQDISSFFN